MDKKLLQAGMSMHPEDMSNLLSTHGLSLSENSENDSQHQPLDHSDNDGESNLKLKFLTSLFLF